MSSIILKNIATEITEGEIYPRNTRNTKPAKGDEGDEMNCVSTVWG